MTNELDQQINNLRTLQQSYDAIAQTADLYQQGRTELAAAITEKGQPTTATQPLTEMAQNVSMIQQRTIDIDGGEMYGAQLFGAADPAISPLWNLYEVLAQMKNTYLGADQYKALIVCEYYKGYDSLQLQGADAYYTCDGAFYDYDANHVWTDAENGRANRWVCFLYRGEGARLDITNTAISPRSMYIGGHIGTIEYFVNGRLTDFVCGVEDTDVVDNLLFKGYSQSWGRNIILRGVKKVGKGFPVSSTQGDGVIIVDAADLQLLQDERYYFSGYFPNAPFVIFPNSKKISGDIIFGAFSGYGGTNTTLLGLWMPSVEECTADRLIFGAALNLADIIVGGMTTNLKIAEWDPTNVLADATKKAQLIDNIKNHILARVSDATGGAQLVFTISANMYNEIASENITWNEQTMTLADAFLTKNWLLAGA